MLNYFRTTAFKFKIATIIYKILTALGLKKQRIIQRNGIKFDIDLAEGVDLSLFLFGSFQKNVTQSKQFNLPNNAIIIDVGANIGSIALPLAQACPQGKIYAFEPTDFAFKKLQRNIQLNAHLERRIKAIQSLVSASCDEPKKTKIYSSWNLEKDDSTRHQIHHGSAMTSSCAQTTIDSFINEQRLEQLDFIKIDTDGHELDVLKGAVNAIKKFSPIIVFELTQYLLKEKGISFTNFESLFSSLKYRLIDTKSGREISQKNYLQLVPKSGSTDIAAIPLDV